MDNIHKKRKLINIRKKIKNRFKRRKLYYRNANKRKFKFQKIYKIMLFIFIIFVHIYCNYYSKKLLNYYYTKRLNIIREWNIPYDESNLITIEDKINWITMHDVTKLKGKCADKIL